MRLQGFIFLGSRELGVLVLLISETGYWRKNNLARKEIRTCSFSLQLIITASLLFTVSTSLMYLSSCELHILDILFPMCNEANQSPSDGSSFDLIREHAYPFLVLPLVGVQFYLTYLNMCAAYPYILISSSLVFFVPEILRELRLG
jgi:hypothetical protein